jgi:hypothetical protein
MNTHRVKHLQLCRVPILYKALAQTPRLRCTRRLDDTSGRDRFTDKQRQTLETSQSDTMLYDTPCLT